MALAIFCWYLYQNFHTGSGRLATFTLSFEIRRVGQRNCVWRACAKAGLYLGVLRITAFLGDLLSISFPIAVDTKLGKRIVGLAWVEDAKKQNTAAQNRHLHDWNWNEKCTLNRLKLFFVWQFGHSLVLYFYPSWLVKNLSHFLNQSGAGRNWSSLVPSRFPRLPLRTTGFELWLVHFDVCMLLLCRPKIVLIIKVRISYKRGKVRKEMFKSL